MLFNSLLEKNSSLKIWKKNTESMIGDTVGNYLLHGHLMHVEFNDVTG